MAGHSHWRQIKHKKQAADAKRGKLFSKLSRAIIIAAREGGGDPSANLKLRYAIDRAKAASMPADTIERAIKKGTGELGAERLEEITYEGYGPGGVGILVEVLTDNRNRTGAELRRLFERAGGKLATSGSVAWMFETRGVCTVEGQLDPDTLLEVALEAGADDVKPVDDAYEVYCDPSQFQQLKNALEAAGFSLRTAEIAKIPNVTVDIDDPEVGRKLLKLLDELDEHDDVQNVYANYTMSDELMQAAAS